MGWIRIDKGSGKQEPVSENRVREVAGSYFKDISLVMATGTVPTPFAVFRSLSQTSPSQEEA